MKSEKQNNVEIFYCMACKEEIHPDANICSHCHTSQQPERWKTFFECVKFIAGITVVISLISVLNQAHIVLNAWHEKYEIVSEIVTAAELQSNSGNYEGSWTMLEEALQMNPGSQKARQFQTKLAMNWIRKGSLGKKQQLQNNMDKILPVLYRGAGSNNPEKSADALAYLGWANFLITVNGLKNLDVDIHFKQALEQDTDNVNANVFYGYWLLDRRNKSEYDFDKLTEASRRFKIALNQGNNESFVLPYQFIALQEHLGTVSALIQALKIAESAQQDNISLNLFTVFEMKEAIYNILKNAEKTGQENYSKTYHTLLKAGFDGQRLLTIYSLFKGYNPTNGSSFDDKDSVQYLVARLDELDGKLEKILDYHVKHWTQRYFTFSNENIFRILKKQGSSFDELLYFSIKMLVQSDRNAENAGVRNYDMLLTYAGISITSYEQLTSLIAKNEKEEQIPLVILRQDSALQYSIHKLQVKGGNLGALFNSTEIPSKQLLKYRPAL